MSKLLKITSKLIVVISLIASFLLPIISLATYEDYAIFTEVDPNSKITVASDNISWAGVTNGAQSYVYKDYGAGYFGTSWVHSFKFYQGTMSTSAWVTIYAQANEITTPTGQLATNICFVSRNIADGYYLQLWSDNVSADRSDSWSGVEVGHTYDITISRLGNNLTVTIYEGATLKDTLLVEEWGNTYRYFYGMSSYNYAYPARVCYGSVANLNLASLVDPIVSTLDATEIAYYPTYTSWGALLSGNITSDGGQECSVGFMYKKVADPSYTWYGLAETFATGENFSTRVYGLVFNTAYQYYAYAENDHGLDEGAVSNFTTTLVIEAPSIQTLAYPITINISANTTIVYGQILNDGGANVTAWFKWKPSDNITWNVSTNTTDLVTSSNFSATLSGLVQGITYEYQAVGLNIYGIGEGGIGTFVLTDATPPVVITIGSDEVKDTTAWLLANLVSDGGVNTFVRFQIRKLGLTAWTDTDGQFRSTGDNHTTMLGGLLQDTTYEFRAKATNYKADFTPQTTYGDILIFKTFLTLTAPMIVTDNVTYINDSTVRLRGLISYDGGSLCQVWFQYRKIGIFTWTETLRGEGGVTNDEFENLLFDIEVNINYEWRACGQNDINIGYGLIKNFYIIPAGTGGTGGIGGTGGTGGTSGISGWINQLRTTLGLTGTMGIWAFMGLLILLVSLIFGMAIVATQEKWIKTSIAVAWLLTSVSIVGAFIFTGQLGIWPILILVGGLVVLIILVVSVKFSGGGVDG